MPDLTQVGGRKEWPRSDAAAEASGLHSGSGTPGGPASMTQFKALLEDLARVTSCPSQTWLSN